MQTPLASIFTSITPHGSAFEVLGCLIGVVGIALGFASLFTGMPKNRSLAIQISFCLAFFAVGALGMVWAEVTQDRETEAANLRTVTTLQATMKASISAEQELFRTSGAYSDSFSDLIAARPSLNTELIDHTLEAKSLVKGEEGRSVTIEYNFGDDETFDVVLGEGRVVLRGCKASLSLGCEDGRWRAGN